MIIRASAEIRQNYNKISKECKESDQPIYLTKNGKGDLVVMDVASFEKREEELALKELVLQSIALRLAGDKEYSAKEAREITRKMVEKL
jgi:prevent-host-death family protein